MKKDNMNPTTKMKETEYEQGQMTMSELDQMHAGKMTDMYMELEHMQLTTDMA